MFDFPLSVAAVASFDERTLSASACSGTQGADPDAGGMLAGSDGKDAGEPGIGFVTWPRREVVQ
jgi:hypothetical protein